MDDDTGHHISAAGLAALEAELAELETEGRRAIAARIKTARREWGDLKENSEYHDAKDAQAHLETKIIRLRELRHHAVVVEPGAERRRRRARREVAVRDLDSGREAIHTIVSAAESDPAAGKLSIDSPLGRALTGRPGRRSGDVRGAARGPRASRSRHHPALSRIVQPAAGVPAGQAGRRGRRAAGAASRRPSGVRATRTAKRSCRRVRDPRRGRAAAAAGRLAQRQRAAAGRRLAVRGSVRGALDAELGAPAAHGTRVRGEASWAERRLKDHTARLARRRRPARPGRPRTRSSRAPHANASARRRPQPVGPLAADEPVVAGAAVEPERMAGRARAEPAIEHVVAGPALEVLDGGGRVSLVRRAGALAVPQRDDDGAAACA